LVESEPYGPCMQLAAKYSHLGGRQMTLVILSDLNCYSMGLYWRVPCVCGGPALAATLSAYSGAL